VRDMEAMLQLLSCGHSSIRDRGVMHEGVRISDEGKGGWDKGGATQSLTIGCVATTFKSRRRALKACKKGTSNRCKKG
jgi:hypothetical protein